MRNIKFRYTYCYKNNFTYEYFMLDNIENGEVEHRNQNRQSWFKLAGKEQYTGLKDKNGVEIYEGDILKGKRGFLKNEEDFIGNVKFIGGAFCVESFYISNYHDICEVVGNIHENKDKLKE